MLALNILPDLPPNEVAENLSDLLEPADCPPNTITIRKGKVRHGIAGPLNCLFAVEHVDNKRIYFIAEVSPNKWMLQKGFSPSKQLIEEVEKIIGCKCPIHGQLKGG